MMKEEEIAWVVREFANGRMQTDIGRELGYLAPSICQHVKRFCDQWSGYNVSVQQTYGDERRQIARIALNRYCKQGAQFIKPLPRPEPVIRDRTYTNALNEHVWLLRVEGVPLQEIGRRLGISQTRVRQRMIDFSRRMNRVVRRTHFKLYQGAEPVRDWLIVNSEKKQWI